MLIMMYILVSMFFNEWYGLNRLLFSQCNIILQPLPLSIDYLYSMVLLTFIFRVICHKNTKRYKF